MLFNSQTQEQEDIRDLNLITNCRIVECSNARVIEFLLFQWQELEIFLRVIGGCQGFCHKLFVTLPDIFVNRDQTRTMNLKTN